MIQRAQWPRAIFYGLLFSESILVLLYWIGTVFTHPEFRSLTDLNGEANIPAWFSSSQILLIAILTWMLVFFSKSNDTPSRMFLAIFAAGATLWSIDETSQLHERMTRFIGARYIDWIPELLTSHKAILAIFIAVAFVFLRKVWKEATALWHASRRVCLIAISGFAVCVVGGIVMETIGYKLVSDESGLMWRLEVTFEEFFEMAGASLILYAIMLLVNQKRLALNLPFISWHETGSIANR